ncbi:MAG: SdpI family protein [Oscillochloris sp.]|nr:SdpI family protein [Oscillochloris sp.]
MRNLRVLYILVGLMFISGLAVLPFMPNPAPIHWNIAGEPDGYGSPWMAVLLAPLISLVMVVLMPLLPRFDPRYANYAGFAGSYQLIMTALVLFFALVHVLTIGAALGWPVSIPRAMMFGMGLLFGLIGNELSRVQPNYFVGIRTPWTLADPEVWRRTHRVGGRMMAGAGALMLVLSLFAPEALGFGLGIGAILVASFGAMLYSYWIWRQRSGEIGQP